VIGLRILARLLDWALALVLHLAVIHWVGPLAWPPLLSYLLLELVFAVSNQDSPGKRLCGIKLLGLGRFKRIGRELGLFCLWPILIWNWFPRPAPWGGEVVRG